MERDDSHSALSLVSTGGVRIVSNKNFSVWSESTLLCMWMSIVMNQENFLIEQSYSWTILYSSNALKYQTKCLGWYFFSLYWYQDQILCAPSHNNPREPLTSPAWQSIHPWIFSALLPLFLSHHARWFSFWLIKMDPTFFTGNYSIE